MKSITRISKNIALPMLIGAASISAAKLAELRVVDQDYLMVTVLDGEVGHKDDGLGADANTGANQSDADIVTEYTPFLNTTTAQNATGWLVVSNDDANFGSAGKKPTAVHRKTKLNGHAQLAWGTGDYNYKSTYAHTLYLKLPQSMQSGKTYKVTFPSGSNIDQSSAEIKFDIDNQVSEAIHVNLSGYFKSDFSKAADLHIWMGDGGARDYSSFEGKKVYLLNTATNIKTEVGAVTAWKTTSTNDAFWRDLTKSPVWNIDFTGASVSAGSYRLIVDGIGASPYFWITDEIYYQPFLVSVRGFFYMRIGQDSTCGIRPVPRRPLYIPGVNPANTTVYLTTMQPYHAEWETFGSGDKWDLKTQWATYKKTGNPTNPNATGGHSDAADWDRYLGHVSIVYDMLLPFILSNGKIDDDNLGIAESGNGIPDIIDEARNEVDFFLNLRDGAGYSHGLNNPDGNNVFYQAGPTAVAAWANAANAAMLGEAFRIAGNTALSNRYRDSAVVAWNYASALADPQLTKTQEVGTGPMTGNDFKTTAAAFLYNLTGETKYEDALASGTPITSGTSLIFDEKKYNQTWAVAGYLKTPQTVHQQTVWNNMKAAVIHEAMTVEVANTQSRASRRATPDEGGGYWMTAHNMQVPMIAHAVSTDADQKKQLANAMILEADYGLGRNSMNMIQMTTATTPLAEKRSVTDLYTTGRDDGSPGQHPGHTPYMNLDDWSCGMVMGCPSKLYANDYPADFVTNWPGDEAYHSSRYVWAHGEFTPQQTMRGKTALYGYLYSLGQKNTGAIKAVQKRPEFIPGDYAVRIFNLNGQLIWKGARTILSEDHLGSLQTGLKGLYIVQIANGKFNLRRSVMFLGQ